MSIRESVQKRVLLALLTSRTLVTKSLKSISICLEPHTTQPTFINQEPRDKNMKNGFYHFGLHSQNQHIGLNP